MRTNHVKGTLRYYGTPAEEGGWGKVYMMRAGFFRDVDVVLHWHPAAANSVNNGGMLAVATAKFQFHGIAANAAMAPDRGRSALDAVMLMGNGIEFLREHVPSNTRIHYIITNGGQAPNIVPETAEMELGARSPYLTSLNSIWTRINKIAQGTAMMTETTPEVRDISSVANILPNDALAKVAQKNLEEAGGFRYTPDEMRFAEELRKSLPEGARPDLHSIEAIEPLKPFDPNAPSASTEVGDLSWNVPTIGFSAATFVPGVAPHTWQAAACAGMTIKQKGMVAAAKAMAMTAADLFASPQLVADAKADFEKQMKGKKYESIIPQGGKPPIDYRSK
jgi:aminobenzoyl-glutamate utilization protein B